MTKAQAARLVATLMAAFPNSQVNEGTSAAYEEDLADLDFVSAVQACKRLRRICEFLPSIAKIREAVIDLEHGPRRTGAQAWADVEEAQRRYGYCGEPNFKDPLVERIVKSNWREWCKPENGAADRARFIEHYDQLSKQRRLDVVSGIPLPQLPAPAARPRLRAVSPESPLPVAETSARPRVTWDNRNKPRMTAEELDAALGIGGKP